MIINCVAYRDGNLLTDLVIKKNSINKRLAAMARHFCCRNGLCQHLGDKFKRPPKLQWISGYQITLMIITMLCSARFICLKQLDWL